MIPPAQRRTACIVLAAGSATRFGSDKRLAKLPDGRSLLEATLGSIPDVFASRILVLKQDDQDMAVGLAPGWTVVHAADAALGMGYSLRAGLAALPEGCEAALIALGDMPRIRQATWQALAAALRADALVVPRFAGKRGNPVGIGRACFAALLEPNGDIGARDLIRAQPDAVVWLDCEDPGILVDMDLPTDLEAQGFKHEGRGK